jgi:hypothetical protein
LQTRGALATRITTRAIGAVEILHIGQSQRQSAPAGLARKELCVAHSARVDIVAQPLFEFFVSYNVAKFHLPKFDGSMLNYKGRAKG